MDLALQYYVRLRDKSHGPFTLAQLRELAAGHHLAPDTPLAAAPGGPWTPLSAHPLARELLPRAPERFERTERHSAPPIELSAIIAAAQPRPAPTAGAAPAPPAPAAPVSAPHDVRSLLAFNLALEKKRGLHALAPSSLPPSRRWRDYFVALALIGTLIFAILLVEAYAAVQIQVLAARMPDQFWPVFRAVLFHSPIFGWGLAMFSVFALVLWWLRFVVMEKR